MKIEYKMSFNRRGSRYTDNCVMRTLPEKALLVRLCYENGESLTAALRSYRQKKCMKDVLHTLFGEDRALIHLFRHVQPFRSPDLNPSDYWSEFAIL
ncbi:hypothetical protein TNCV_1040421 [Trichonephila clavipes]|nr:hypothetical protein TNCV_1040421 [Trichonephila clavipes]